MADYDPSISNGTCYWQVGKEAPSRYIPCGNEVGGHIPCCESGDTCLSSRACFNGQFYVTYLAGCTDPDYQHENCPDKGIYDNQTWTGLVSCKSNPREWTGCANPAPSVKNQDISTVISVKPDCFCPATSAEPLFIDAATLGNVATLPVSLGGDIVWGGGLGPTYYQSATAASAAASTPDQTTTAASSTHDISASSTSTTYSPPTLFTQNASTPEPIAATETTPSSMSTGAIAGAAVGGAIGLLALTGIFSYLMQRRYRKKREAEAATTLQEKARSQSAPYTDDAAAAAAGGLPSPSSGFKSELPADSIQTPSPRYEAFRPPSEIEGSQVPESSQSIHGGGYHIPGHKETFYEMP